MLLELLNNRRLLSEASRHVASLSSVTRLFSCSRDTGCFHFNRKPEHILCSPSFPVSLRTLKYNDLNLRKVLKKHYNIDSSLHQVRKGDNQHDIVESSEAITGQLTVGQKVKQAGKDASYLGVLVIGFGITGVLIWYVLSELLFSFSPNSVYSKALDIVKQHAEVTLAVGEPIKAYGEETSRGRRRHVSHQEYIVDGSNYMRVKFYISGSKRKATVHVDTKETSRGKFEFRYIFVELEGYPTETIVVEDNR